MPWKNAQYQRYVVSRRELEASFGGMPYLRSLPHGNTHTFVDEGKEVLNFSSYDYLGLAEDRWVKEAAKDAVDRYGTTCGASRLVSGELDVHSRLEGRLASFLGTESVVTFVSGHATNVATIGFLYGPNDLILTDQFAHNSITEGAKLSGARLARFAHNNVDDLERKLQKLRGGRKRILVCVEGLYSMDGDLAPLDRIAELKDRYGFAMFVDEAHSLGTVGPTGRGAREAFGMLDGTVDIVMGSLSKSLGSCGGFIAGDRSLIDYLKLQCPGFVFSTGLPGPAAAAADAALEILTGTPMLVADLQDKCRSFRRHLRISDPKSDNSTPVVPVLVNYVFAYEASDMLQRCGVRVFPISYPAVAKEAARLRFFVNRSHTSERLLAAAEQVRDTLTLRLTELELELERQ